MVDGNITEQSAAQVGAQESKSRRKIHKRFIVEFIKKFEKEQLPKQENVEVQDKDK